MRVVDGVGRRRAAYPTPSHALSAWRKPRLGDTAGSRFPITRTSAGRVGNVGGIGRCRRNRWHVARISTLEFRLDHAAWDARRRELNAVYEANLNGERKRACGIMCFDAEGRQVSGEALYGAVLQIAGLSGGQSEACPPCVINSTAAR